MNLVVRSQDELIAAVPHVLGFVPENSIVVVPLTTGLPIARLDLPALGADPTRCINTLAVPYRRNVTSGATVAIVCFTGSPEHADQVSRRLAERFEAFGIMTRVRVTASERQWADLDTGERGVRTEQAALRVASETVLAGAAQPKVSRDALIASLHGDPTVIGEALAAALERAVDQSPSEEREWVLVRWRKFEDDGIRLDDSDAARMLVAMRSLTTRDAVWDSVTRDNTPSSIALLSDLVRRAPDDVRPAPAALLGFAAWMNGQGALGWCALDQTPPGKPYAMTAVVATLLDEGLSPKEWPQLREFMRGLACELDASINPTHPINPNPGSIDKGVRRLRPEPPDVGRHRHPEPPAPGR